MKFWKNEVGGHMRSEEYEVGEHIMMSESMSLGRRAYEVGKHEVEGYDYEVGGKMRLEGIRA